MGDHADDALDMAWNTYYDDQSGEGIYPRIKPTGPGPCPRCGAPTVQRHRKSDMKTFYGCSTYPKCKGSRGS